MNLGLRWIAGSLALIVLCSFLCRGFESTILGADEIVGRVKSVKGEVMLCKREGLPFSPAKEGAKLFAGGIVLALDDSSVSLLLDGRGEVVLADNASLRLAQRESSGEYSAVTGVRAPVLFLFPCGDSEIRLGEELSFTFGINHSLDKIAGLKGFEIYGLHEDRAFELGFPEGAEAMEGAELLASFEARDDPSKEGYTWYRVDARPADGAAFEVGEYFFNDTAPTEIYTFV